LSISTAFCTIAARDSGDLNNDKSSELSISKSIPVTFAARWGYKKHISFVNSQGNSKTDTEARPALYNQRIMKLKTKWLQKAS